MVHETPVPLTFLCGPQDTDVRGEYHPTSGFVSPEKGETLLDRLKAYEYERHRTNVPYYPFQDEGEWDLAKFLTLNLMKSQISQFLKLKWVCDLSLSNFKLQILTLHSSLRTAQRCLSILLINCLAG